jgi:hypothetical protein
MALHFPIDVDKLTNRPFLHFTCTGSGDRAATITLPMPGSISFGDESTYNNAELGVVGGYVNEVAGLVGQGSEKLASGVSAIGGRIAAAGQSKGINEIVQGISALSGVSEGLQSAINIGTGTTLNKNITTEFTATNTRTFSFAFQLIARTEKENDMIKKIVRAFRQGVYPEGNDFQLKFPPKWQIKFMLGGVAGKTEISDIPKIGDVYLTGATTVYNSSANMWRTDGSPLETTLTVNFIETKAHTLESLPK